MPIDISKLKSETKSSFLSQYPEQIFANVIWQAKKQKAQFATSSLYDETICGMDLSLTEDKIIEIEDASAATKAPYGNVTYADPGYQKDGKKRYPIDTEEHIRAAWSYINQEKNHKGYSSDQVAKIKSRIVSAWKKKIDPKGPPSAA